MSTVGGPISVFTVLLVCTGNICRSAFAERLARAYLDEALGDGASEVQFLSAGTHAVVDAAMHPHSALVLAGFGAEAGDFRARQLTDTMPAEVDLVLTMTRAHRRDALARAPRGLARTFTLREAAALLKCVGDASSLAGATFSDRARGLVAALAAARPRRSGGGGDEDVPDPIGQGLEVHEAVGEAIVEALLPLLDRIASLR